MQTFGWWFAEKMFFFAQSAIFENYTFRAFATADSQLPASAGSRTINAAIHNPTQIKKFLLPAISPVFMVSPFPILLLAITRATAGPSGSVFLFSVT